MRSSAALFLALILPAACAHVPQAPGRTASYLGPVRTLDGREVHLSSYLQDRVTMVPKDGKMLSRVECADYLLLVVGRTDCEWTVRQIEELVPHLATLRGLRVRTVAVLREQEEPGVAKRLARKAEDAAILSDPDGSAYGFYVKTVTPSVNVIDSWGNRLLGLEGFVKPGTLVRKIREGDFAEIPTDGG